MQILFRELLLPKEWLTNATQAKIMSYCNQHLEDDFTPLIVEIFGCLYLQVDNFFIDVPTWHDQQKALKVLLFRLYVHFTSKGC
jgi:hypothetical protein